MAGLIGLVVYMSVLQRPLAVAVVSKAIGKDEPCPWGHLLKFPWALEKFIELRESYERRVIPREVDANLGIQRFDTPTRSFWLKQRGEALDGKTLLAYILAEEDWIMHYSPEHQVQPGDVVVDVGAHVGTFDDDALRHGASKVIMIEPDPVNVECIRRNFPREIAEGKVVIIPEGAWSSDGSMDFSLGVRNSGTGSLLLKEEGASTIKVPVRRMDDMFRDLKIGKVDFIKMDIEGAEREALKGAAQTLRKYKPTLMLDSYHLPDDPAVLPVVVEAANPEYRPNCAVCSVTRDPHDHRIIPYAVFYR
jgi:FkbM family methyltransferase